MRGSAEAGQPHRQPLHEWLVYPERKASPAYLTARKDMRRKVKSMALAIDGMMTREQRRHLLAELEGLIDDVQDLTGTERRVAWEQDGNWGASDMKRPAPVSETTLASL